MFMNHKGDLYHPVGDYLKELINEIPENQHVVCVSRTEKVWVNVRQKGVYIKQRAYSESGKINFGHFEQFSLGLWWSS